MSQKIPIDNRPIGIFDSGLGGLTVVSALKKSLPNEQIIYLGDTARVPYGDKSPESILRFAVEDCAFLESKGVKMIIAACNTVSAVALPELAEKSNVPVLGVIECGVDSCLAENPRSAAVIGTRATINSDSYRKMIHARNPQVIVQSIACPLFVPLAEEGLYEHQIARTAVDLYLSGLKNSPPDVILLGCTHYPLLRKRSLIIFLRV